MNTEKVGSFIAQRRKEKNLTQKQLADLLGVTDKAVSRWETGKGYPDIETLKLLSEQLQVSLNELLSGEIIPEERIAESADFNIVYAYRKEKKTKKYSRIIIAILLVCCIIMGVFYGVNMVADNRKTCISSVSDTNRKDMITKIENVLWEEFGIGGKEIFEHVVCTDFHIMLNTEDEISELEMVFQSRDFGYRAEVELLEEEQVLRFERSYEDVKKLESDGFTYNSIMDALKNIDMVSLCKKHTAEPFSEFWVDFAGEVTYSDRVAEFASDYQYLYKDGELIFADTTEILQGKNYTLTLTPKVDVGGNMAYGSCCNVYIKR